MTTRASIPPRLSSQSATLGAGVRIGPYAIVGDRCEIGDGVVVETHAVLEQNVKLAADVIIGVGSVIGGDPQDLKFKGEETWVEIGEGTRVREYATINRGTAQSFQTTVGKGCFVMSYVHLAHDCHVGDGVIISNGTQLAGHVKIDDRAIISGLCAVHQFVKIGRHAFVGGMLPRGEGYPALREGGREPGEALRIEHRGPEAQRLLGGDGLASSRRRTASSSAPTSTCRRRWSGRARSCSTSPRWRPSSRFVEETGRGVVIMSRRPSASAWSAPGASATTTRASCARSTAWRSSGLLRGRAERAAHGRSASSASRAFDRASTLIDERRRGLDRRADPEHHEVAMAALAKGKHLLIEKPITVTLAEADELLALAERQGVIVQIGHIERFNRAIRAAMPYVDRPRSSSTATGSRRSTRAAPTWRSCST